MRLVVPVRRLVGSSRIRYTDIVAVPLQDLLGAHVLAPQETEPPVPDLEVDEQALF